MKREQNKEGRRRNIIQATEALIRETGSTQFAMKDLAARAGVSTATTYNLFKSKAEILYILLNRALDRVNLARLATMAAGDPFEHVFQAADAAVGTYTSDSQFYRPLLGFTFATPDPVYRPPFIRRPYNYWLAVVAALDEHGHLDQIEASDLAREFQLLFMGVTSMWIHGELDAQQFRAQVRHGIALSLMALGVKSAMPRLQREIEKARAILQPLYTTA